MSGEKLRPRAARTRAVTVSVLVHLVILAGVYFTADFFPRPEGFSVATAEDASSPAFFLDLGADAPAPEQTLASSTPFDAAVARPLIPVVEPRTTAGDHGPTGSPQAGPSGAGTVPAQKPSWFPQADGKVRSVVFVLDRSGSMGQDGRLRRALQELRRTIEALPSESRFHILAYNRFVERFPDAPENPATATAESKRRAIAWLDSLPPEGATDSLAALRQAVALEADLIYFVTDGDDLPDGAVSRVTRLNHGRSCIHALNLAPAGSSASSPLAELAHANGGTYRCVDLRTESVSLRGGR
jgi:hypothetical protein